MYHRLGYTYIYQPLSFPFGSLKASITGGQTDVNNHKGALLLKIITKYENINIRGVKEYLLIMRIHWFFKKYQFVIVILFIVCGEQGKLYVYA